MSTDYAMVCHKCGEVVHIGQLMAGRWSFGWGTPSPMNLDQYIHDTRRQGEWLLKHSGHDPVFMVSDAAPITYKDCTNYA